MSHLSKGWSICQKVGPFVKRVVHLSKGAVHLSKVCQNAQLLYYCPACNELRLSVGPRQTSTCYSNASVSVVPDGFCGAHVDLVARVERLDRTERFELPTLHVSCQSDIFTGGDDMAGMILWLFDGKREWSLNGVECKPGYIVFKKSASIRHIPSDIGEVHGKLYKYMFGEDPDERVLATGFAFYKGKWEWLSGTFNNRNPAWQGNDPEAGPNEQQIIKAAILKWSQSDGRSQTFHISELIDWPNPFHSSLYS